MAVYHGLGVLAARRYRVFLGQMGWAAGLRGAIALVAAALAFACGGPCEQYCEVVAECNDTAARDCDGLCDDTAAATGAELNESLADCMRTTGCDFMLSRADVLYLAGQCVHPSGNGADGGTAQAE